MLTQDQINNLKHGDTVLVEAEVSSPLKEGAVVTHGCITHALPASKLYPLPSEHGTLVPPPKHDPCRPFKAGDVARVVERFGRIDATHTLGALVTVTRDECGLTFVHVKHETGAEGLIPWLYLELVTPVQELEPYSVSEATVQYLVKEDNKKVVAQFCKLYHPNAKAAAEAERDRLNAEWRKEHGND